MNVFVNIYSDLSVAWLIIIRPMLLMVSSEQTLCSVAHIAKVGNGNAQAQSILPLHCPTEL